MPPQFLPESHGHDALGDHALHLLELFENAGDCRAFLSELPLFSADPEVTLDKIAEHYQAQVSDLCLDNVNSHAALEVVPWIGDTMVYPLAVLLEATARATAIPLVFWIDLVQSFGNAVVHKRAGVQLTERYHTKNRYWMVGTANVAEGKSPAMMPVVEAVERALHQNTAFTVGSPGDQFHLQQGSTSAAAREKLRFCDGYLAIHSDEAGACLCPAFANGGATDPSKFIDFQLFLNAAHGGSFSFSTQVDRQKVLKHKVPDPTAPVPEPVGMTLKETNVHIIFLQQELFLSNWWAPVAATKPLGLVQRFLFSFGARLNMGKQSWNGFLQDVTVPILEQLFSAIIRRFGPHITTSADFVFETTHAQRAVIVELEEIGRLFARKDSVHTVFREAMPKAMYWLGTAVLTNHLVANLWPSALGRDLPDEFPTTVSNECFIASVQFMLKRYLFGQAILSVTSKEQTWLHRRHDFRDAEDDLLPLLLRILRGAPGSVITLEHIFCADLALKRSIEKGSCNAADLARQRIADLWLQLKDLGLGELCSSGGTARFRKYHVGSLSPGCLDWLRKHRVPLSHFGKRSHVDHAAFLGTCRGGCVDVDSGVCGSKDTAVDSGEQELQPLQSAVPRVAKPSPQVARGGASAHPNQPAKPRKKKQAIQWRDISRVELGSPLMSNQQLLQHLRRRPEWADTRVAVRTLWQNKERILSEVRCVESELCTHCWRTHYILSKSLYSPGTLVVQASGEHTGHDGAVPCASGKIFNEKQREIAARFLSGGGRGAKNLRVALLAAGCADASLPDNTQLANWLRNNSRKNKDALDKDKSVVAAVALEVSQLPRSLPKQIDALFLLRDPIITDTEVCILFASPGTLNTFDRYTGLDVALSVDTKMKVLTRGMGVATVSLLVKDQLRKTRLPKLGKGSRTQSRAWTSHGMPVAQAIFHAETKPNYCRLFRTCCDLWAERQPSRLPLPEQRSLQIHKDFHPSAEEARREVFPHSRACDDFFHFKEKSHTVMRSKCRQVVLHKGKHVKKHLHYALTVVSLLRFIPTLPLFSWLWKAFLASLRRMDEPILADWLQSYERPLPSIFSEQAAGPQDLIYVSFWVGFDGIIPGSGSGSEPAEAVHGAWQTELASLGGRGDINHCLCVLQRLYTQHWQDWYSWMDASPLSFQPAGQDPQLVNGAALARAGRTTAANFSKLPPNSCYVLQQSTDHSWVACAATAATSPVNRSLAQGILRFLLQPTLLHANSLPQLFDDSGNLSLQALRFHFEDVVYLRARPTSLLCSCAAATMHAQCEHSTFLRSLALPTFPSDSLLLNDVPKARKRTGRRTTAAEPPRKRRRRTG